MSHSNLFTEDCNWEHKKGIRKLTQNLSIKYNSAENIT